MECSNQNIPLTLLFHPLHLSKFQNVKFIPALKVSELGQAHQHTFPTLLKASIYGLIRGFITLTAFYIQILALSIGHLVLKYLQHLTQSLHFKTKEDTFSHSFLSFYICG